MTQNDSLEEVASRILSDSVIEEVSAFYRVGHALHERQRNDEANEVIDSALALLATVPSHSEIEVLAASLNALRGITRTATGQHLEASKAFTEATHSFEQLGLLAGQYYAVLGEAIRLSKRGEAREAIRAFRTAESLDREHDIEKDILRKYALQCNIVEALVQLQDFDGVLNQVSEAQKWIPFRACKELAAILIQGGNCAALLGQFQFAKEAYEDVRRIGEELEDAAMQGMAHARLGLCLRTEWERSSEESLLYQSIAARKRALDLYCQAKNADEVSCQWREIVRSYEALGEEQLAIDSSIAAAKADAHAGRHESAFQLIAHAAHLSVKLGKQSEALALYQRALNDHEGSPEDRQRVVSEIARLYYAKNDYEGAAEWLSCSCDLLAALGRPTAEAKERQLFAYVLLKLGKQESGEAELTRAEAICRSLS